MNTKIPLLVICVEAIIYFLLYNLHDCTFNAHRNKIRQKNRIRKSRPFFKKNLTILVIL